MLELDGLDLYTVVCWTLDYTACHEMSHFQQGLQHTRPNHCEVCPSRAATEEGSPCHMSQSPNESETIQTPLYIATPARISPSGVRLIQCLPGRMRGKLAVGKL